MTRLKALARDWFPPAMVRWVGQVRGRAGITFEGDFATWDRARAQSTGYEAKEILDKVLAATLTVKRGEAAFERDSVIFSEIEYVWPVLTGLLWVAARNGGVLNVLDVGGALGSSYFQNRKFLNALPEIRWNIVEQAQYVEAGRIHVQDGVLRFYESIEACLAENKPNVILLSSVLQYLEAPREIITQLPRIGASVLLIDRTPFSTANQDKLVIQRVPASIYEASYSMWIFSMHAFMNRLDTNWRMIASTVSPEGVIRSTNNLEFSFQGMLLESKG